MAFFKRKDNDKRGKDGKRKPRLIAKKRMCRFCADKKLFIDYKEGKLLLPFTTERGKIVPRRISGNCAKHQREITEAVKRARILALLPYTATQLPMEF